MFAAKRAILVFFLEALVLQGVLLFGEDCPACLFCSAFSSSSASLARRATAAAASQERKQQQQQQQQQRNLVEQQLGYVPSNFVRIAAFCRDGSPLVLQTYPLAGGSPRRQARSSSSNSKNSNNIQTPFPTLYWLCHPQVNKCVAELERRGCVAEFQCRLDDHPQLRNAWMEAHREYAVQRWESLTAEDQRRFDLLDDTSSNVAVTDDGASKILESKRHILRDSGIAGSNITDSAPSPSIKCLHAHYAHYRGTTTPMLIMTNGTKTTIKNLVQTANPVGAMVHERLQAEFPELIL